MIIICINSCSCFIFFVIIYNIILYYNYNYYILLLKWFLLLCIRWSSDTMAQYKREMRTQALLNRRHNHTDTTTTATTTGSTSTKLNKNAKLSTSSKNNNKRGHAKVNTKTNSSTTSSSASNKPIKHRASTLKFQKVSMYILYTAYVIYTVYVIYNVYYIVQCIIIRLLYIHRNINYDIITKTILYMYCAGHVSLGKEI